MSRQYVAMMKKAASAARSGDLQGMQSYIGQAEKLKAAHTKSGALKPKHMEKALALFRTVLTKRHAKHMNPIPYTSSTYLPGNSITGIDAFGYSYSQNPRVRRRRRRNSIPYISGEYLPGNSITGVDAFGYSYTQGAPNPRSKKKPRKWIKKAIKRPGALRRKLASWYGLKPKQLIPLSMLNKAYRRAKKKGDTRTMRQVNLAKRLKGFSKKRRKGKVIRGVKFGAKRVRKVAANKKKSRRRKKRRNRLCTGKKPW